MDTTILGIIGENPMVIIITTATRAADIITGIRSAIRSMEIGTRDGTYSYPAPPYVEEVFLGHCLGRSHDSERWEAGCGAAEAYESL